MCMCVCDMKIEIRLWGRKGCGVGEGNENAVERR